MIRAEMKLRRLRRENAALRRRLKRKFEFSKVIFVGVSAVTLAITLFSCVMTWITRDTAVLCYLIPAVFAEMASATGFYYSKAKAENQIKLSALHSAENSNETGG